jgi:hypothetical protein
MGKNENDYSHTEIIRGPDGPVNGNACLYAGGGIRQFYPRGGFAEYADSHPEQAGEISRNAS